jgi:hypothetical protein
VNYRKKVRTARHLPRKPVLVELAKETITNGKQSQTNQGDAKIQREINFHIIQQFLSEH